VGLEIVDWKSTVVSNLLVFLLLNTFPDHVVGDRTGGDSQMLSLQNIPKVLP
jgi:hypothetical protein